MDSGSSTIRPASGRAFLSRAVAIGVGLIVGVFVAEIGLRIGGAARGSVSTVSAESFLAVPGIFEPGLDVVVRTAWGHEWAVSIDSLGYRGRSFPRAKPADELRVLFVGDSFAFGYLVDNDETLPSQLEGSLARRCVGPVRVVNAGLGGSTISAQRHMVARALELDPDLVIVQFHENDISDLVGAPMWEALASNRETKGRFPMSVLHPLLRQTALGTLASRTAVMMLSGDQDGAAAPSPDRDRGAREGLRATYERDLMEVYETLSERGIPMVLASFPTHRSVYDAGTSELIDWLDATALRNGIRHVSFLETLVGDGGERSELYFMPNDGHATRRGYEVAAEALTDALMSFDRVGDACGIDDGA